MSKGSAQNARAATVSQRTATPGGGSHRKKGRRYGVAEKKEALTVAAEIGVAAAARQMGVSAWSIYEWKRRAEQAATVEEKEQALKPRSSRPKRNAQKLDEERYRLIADTWLKNQALGPRQVRNLLRRSHGLRAGTSTVRRVMAEHGYVPPKITVERKDVRRYEAVRPLQQAHADFLTFYVHKAKVYLLLIEDDYSRWILGWTLCEGERAAPVIETFDDAIARHGKPECVVVDGGSGFFSWKGQSQFEKVCDDYGIDFIKAGKAGGNAKLEALNGTLRRELLSRVEFDDLDVARRKIAEYIRFYNLERPHEGLGGLLVPADRFFGRIDEVMAQIERGDPVVVPGLGLETRPLELFRVISRGGRPELWLLGQRLWPLEASAAPATTPR
jgi:transposase InsO family protein